jgi:hypothetical protein
MPRKNGKIAVEGVDGVEWLWIAFDWAGTMVLKSGQNFALGVKLQALRRDWAGYVGVEIDS